METKTIKCWNCKKDIEMPENKEITSICPHCKSVNSWGGFVLLKCYDCKRVKINFNACLNCDNTYNIVSKYEPQDFNTPTVRINTSKHE